MAAKKKSTKKPSARESAKDREIARLKAQLAAAGGEDDSTPAANGKFDKVGDHDGVKLRG